MREVSSDRESTPERAERKPNSLTRDQITVGVRFVGSIGATGGPSAWYGCLSSEQLLHCGFWKATTRYSNGES